MSQVTIQFSQMNVSQLVAAHNALAPARGVPELKAWRDDRVKLVQRVALLRASSPVAKVVKPKPKPRRGQRRQPVREAAMAALRFIDHYEDKRTGKKLSKRAGARRPRDEVRSVGLSYADVLERIRKKFPDKRASGLRVYVANARENRECTFPDKRPRSSWEGTR